MADITLLEAVNLALGRALADDADVVLLGQDIGIDGGVFRATLGLVERFGPERVLDTPIAEQLLTGMAIGMAAQGLKPVVEIQFSGFAYTCIDQLLNHAGRLRHRTQGRMSCPMVLRTPCGCGIHPPEHHSESPEGMFAHIPGIRVVYPSSPRKAYGLLLAAIRDPDPVVFLEPTRMYRLIKEAVEDDGTALPLDTCFTLRPGTDLTLVAWGAMIHDTLQAARQLEADGISAEVIDVATLRPLDMETILRSVASTGRCVIVTEAVRSGGVAAEIAAAVAGEGLFSLLAPIERVTSYDVVIPLPRLEHLYMPDATRIVEAARRAMRFA